MTKPATDDIRLRNRAGLTAAGQISPESMNTYNAMTGSQTMGIATSEPAGKVTPIAKKMDLDAAYARYKNGKGFGRSDLFLFLIDEIKELKARIGSVDEAKVAEIDGRMSALERTIGNALGAAAPEKRGPGRPPKKAEGGE